MLPIPACLLTTSEDHSKRELDVNLVRSNLICSLVLIARDICLQAAQETHGNVTVSALQILRVSLVEVVQCAEGAQVGEEVVPGHLLAQDDGARIREIRIMVSYMLGKFTGQ